MPSPVSSLTRTSVLCLSFAAMILLGALLRQTGEAIGGMLDLQLTGTAARALLARLSPYQQALHAHATLVYDGLYPLAYGAFFAGLATRLGGRSARWVAWTMLAGMVADYTENTIQLLALGGTADWLDAKTVITPVKFALTGLAIVATLVLAGRAGLSRLKSRH